MFTGLHAFPLTPADEMDLDEAAFAQLVSRLAAAGVDAIDALGSTGSYPYFTRDQRARAARIAVDNARGAPVVVGIGALRTSEVLALAEDAQRAGASAVLLAPVSYQPLTSDEVFGLYADVTRELSVPLCVYDNPGTTGFTFDDELHGRIAELPGVRAIKIPGIPAERAAERLTALRRHLPAGIAVGVSGDEFAAAGLSAGADAWFSVLGGLLPDECLAITRAARSGDAQRAEALSERLRPVWDLFRQHGSLRTTAAAAHHLGLVAEPNLPRPLRGLDGSARRELATALDALDVRA